MGLFDGLKDLIKPETILEAAEGLIPPSGRAIINLLPSLMKSRYDLSKHAAPAITIKKKDDTNQVAVVYSFKNREDADAFFTAETESLKMVATITKAIEGGDKQQ